MKKSRGIVVMLLSLIIIAALGMTCVNGMGSEGSGAAKNIKLGLDLAGGVSITYGAVEENPSAEDMADTVYKLQKRVEGYSTEARVYQEGADRISIEIPGVSDANAILEELGKPGSLEFQTEEGETFLDGTDIETAEAGSTQDSMGNSEFVVKLTLTKDGGEKFARVTAENVGKYLPIVYDGEVIRTPRVQEAITGGSAMITGMASYEDAENLASTIRIGALSLELTELQSKTVGAQLGQEAIATSLTAGLIGLICIFLFMCVVYRIPGLAASLALMIYTELMVLLINAFELTLTLPGIAGIILSIGMAVDANVIIFERIREELGTGKTVKSSMKIGFKKALSAIVDGNITTLIAALVLGIKGSGSVKGFAQTLGLGIVLSMFTALVVTRLILNALVSLGFKDVKFFGAKQERKTIHFLAKRKLCFAVSLVVVLLGFVFMGVNHSQGKDALNYSLEFKGGTSTNVVMQEDMSIAEIDSRVKPVVEAITGDGDVQIQKVTGSSEIVVKTRSLSVQERQELNDALTEQFGVDESKITSENISSSVSAEMKRDAVIAVVIATFGMLLYIWFRFKDIRFAASAVTALVHDVLVVLAFYAAARISVGSTFIACMLTIVGYSINATIVIFDRIRENLGEMKRKDELEDLVNRSITQTLTRSVYTSFTTLITVVVLYILGVTAIREFALPLIVGIICGAYSSVCITGALWYVMKKRQKIKTES